MFSHCPRVLILCVVQKIIKIMKTHFAITLLADNDDNQYDDCAHVK